MRQTRKANLPKPPPSPQWLWRALRAKDTGALRGVLASGSDANASDPDQEYPETPLVHAFRHWPAAVQDLLNAGADPNLCACDGTSPLLLAINHNPRWVGPMIKAGARVADKVSSNLSPLRAACGESCRRSGHQLKTLDRLLASGADPNEMLGGVCLLANAVDCAPPEIIERLLEAGANPNGPEGSSRPLWRVVHRAGPESRAIARLLIRKNARVDGVDAKGTPLLVELLAKTSLTPGYSFVPMLDLLLKAGADPNASDASGQTPLMAALPKLGMPAGPRHERALARLFRAGADPSVEDAQGESLRDKVYACAPSLVPFFEGVLARRHAAALTAVLRPAAPLFDRSRRRL